MKREDFEVKTVKMNGSRVKIRIPKRVVSEEEFKKKLYEVFKRHA